MPTSNFNTVVKILNAIEEDWAFCDKSDEDDQYALVSESREEHTTLNPKKSLIQDIEEQGLIRFDEEKSDLRNTKREYEDFFGELESVWKVFFFQVTAKGKERIDA